MTVLKLPSKSSTVQLATEDELALLKRFIGTAIAQDSDCDRQSLTHLLVTFKAHASILIAGPAKTGKIALVRAFDQTLGDGSTNHLQMMVGHARWASGTRNITKFVELQSRFNDNQILSLMEEASRAENHRHLFIACLTRITPFEIYRYLSAPGFQFWPWMTQQKGSGRDERLLTFPLNFRLISTMDTAHFQWWDRDLLAHTAVVQWTEGVASTIPQPVLSAGSRPAVAFSDVCVRETSAAYRKLTRLLRGIKEPFGPLMQVMKMMNDHGVHLPPLAVNQTVRYLANAWSKDGKGLFVASNKTNLRVGLDMALMQYVLSWAMAIERLSYELQQHLTQLLDGRFPRAADFTRRWPDSKLY